MAASTSGKRGRGRPPRPTAEDGPKIRILLGRGAKAQAMRQEVNSIRRECGLETIGDTVEFLCSKWRRRGLTNRLLNLERHKPGTQRAEAMASNSLPRKRGRGRPATAAGGPKISILLGRGSRAQTIRKEVESIQKDYGLDTLGDTIEFLCAKWKSGRMMSDACTQAVPTANASTQCSLVQPEQKEQPRVHVVTVASSQCLPLQPCVPQMRDQVQMFSLPFVSVTNPPYFPMLQAPRQQIHVMADASGQLISVPAPVRQAEGLQVQAVTDQTPEATCSSAQLFQTVRPERRQKSESPDLVIAEEPPPPKRLSEPARITDTTKKALLECLETRRSSQPSLRGRGRGRRGRKRGRKT